MTTGQPPVQVTSSAQSIVHNITSQASITAQPAHHQQIIHQKGAHSVTFGPPSGIRTVSANNYLCWKVKVVPPKKRYAVALAVCFVI